MKQIIELRKDLSRLDQWSRSILKNKDKMEYLERKYHVKAKGMSVVLEELRQRAKTARIKRYEEQNNAFMQNRLFQSNQKKLFEMIDGYDRENEVRPDANESKKFWSELWDKNVTHNENAEWLTTMKREYQNVEMQPNINVTEEKVKTQIKKMRKWKACGPDGVHGYWLKEFTSLHSRISEQLDECLQTGQVASWMTKGRTSLILKDQSKGNIVSNFRPITCLPLMWKLLTGIIAKETYLHLQSNGLFPEEQKGCRKESRGTKDQLMIDKMALKNCRRRMTNLCLSWIDYKKAYDMVPHSWLMECTAMLGVALNEKVES